MGADVFVVQRFLEGLGIGGVTARGLDGLVVGFGRVVGVLCVVVFAVEASVFAGSRDAHRKDAVRDHTDGEEQTGHQQGAHPDGVFDVCVAATH